MEYIKIKENEEIVRIEITMEFPGAGVYNYVINENLMHEYDNGDRKDENFPHHYMIGTGKDILNKNDHNNWDFHLTNSSEDTLDYKVFIKWFQGDNLEPIHVWPIEELWEGEVSKSDHIQKSEIAIYQKL